MCHCTPSKRVPNCGDINCLPRDYYITKEKYRMVLDYVKKRSYLQYDSSIMSRLKIQRPLAYHQILEAREVLKTIGEI